MSFTKFDDGKIKYHLIDFDFEKELASILTEGAARYGEYNWQEADPVDAEHRYYSALRRHLDAWLRGTEVDPDTGLPHLAHAACNIMFLRWFERNHAKTE